MQNSLFGAADPALEPTLLFEHIDGSSHEYNPDSGTWKAPPPPEVASLAWHYTRKDFHYIALSALHKEIRRGDVGRAVNWCRIFIARQGEKKVKEYCRRILFEETRNIDLAVRWQHIRSVQAEDMVRAMAASPKKWELKEREGVIEEYLRAYDAAQDTPISSLGSEEWYDRVQDSQDLSELFTCLWEARRVPEGTEFLEAVRDRLKASDRLADVAHQHDHYSGKVIIEKLLGYLPPEASVLRPQALSSVARKESPVVPPVPAYVYDLHTLRGARLYTKHLRDIAPRKPLPEEVDLRFSGMLRGVVWREFAARGGRTDWKDRAWEDVFIPGAVWHLACRVDRFYYERVCDMAGV